MVTADAVTVNVGNGCAATEYVPTEQVLTASVATGQVVTVNIVKVQAATE